MILLPQLTLQAGFIKLPGLKKMIMDDILELKPLEETVMETPIVLDWTVLLNMITNHKI